MNKESFIRTNIFLQVTYDLLLFFTFFLIFLFPEGAGWGGDYSLSFSYVHFFPVMSQMGKEFVFRDPPLEMPFVSHHLMLPFV